MAVIDTRNMISLTDVGKRGLSALVREAEAGVDQIVIRNNHAVAAVISISRLEQLQQFEDELADVTLAVARVITATDERSSLEDVLDEFGFTRADLT